MTPPPPAGAPAAREVRAVLLDLDGVVTDTAVQHADAWRRLLAEHDLRFDADAYERTRGRSRADSLDVLLHGAGAGGRVVDRDAMLRRKNALYLEAVADLDADDVLPGVRRLIDDARMHGLLVGLGSSSRNARQVLEHLGIAGLFDAVADGHAGAPKPSPDIFLAAAAQLQVAPGACVVIEDAAAGVDAARAAGMRSVGVGPAERVGHADLRVDTTSGLDLDRILTALSSGPGPASEAER